MPQPPSTRARRGPRLSAEERRESILRAATEVFAEHGYQRGRTPDIAARVGVTEPVVFQNFGSKAALYAAVVERACHRMAEAIEATATGRTPVPVLLARLLSRDHVAELHSPGAAGFLFADAMNVTGEPAVEAAVHAGTRAVAAALSEVLRRGQSAGEVRADLDPEAMAWWLLSFLASHRFRDAALRDDPALAGRLDDVVLRALTG